MALWLTYAWADNTSGDVDYVAQELRKRGVEVRLDRFVLKAGEPIWEQIGNHISDPTKCSAWAIYATKASLESNACREEYNLALGRAVAARGRAFPIFGLFPESYDEQLLPASLRVRLGVIMSDPQWTERVMAAVQSRQPVIGTEPIDRFVPTMHPGTDGHSILELRVRAGRVYPIVVGVPAAEEKSITAWVGPSGAPIHPMMLQITTGYGDGLATVTLGEPVTPVSSLYLRFNTIPEYIRIGEEKSRTATNMNIEWYLRLERGAFIQQ